LKQFTKDQPDALVLKERTFYYSALRRFYDTSHFIQLVAYYLDVKPGGEFDTYCWCWVETASLATLMEKTRSLVQWIFMIS
jgi:hypothetical protein